MLVSNRLTRLFTEPLVQFLIIGACIYGAFSLFGTPEEDFRDTTIIVDANRIDAFIGQWESRWNRPPTRQEIDGIIQQYVREDILYRQAVAMGLNEDDPTFLVIEDISIQGAMVNPKNFQVGTLKPINDINFFDRKKPDAFPYLVTRNAHIRVFL
jgi:hypothetical protein